VTKSQRDPFGTIRRCEVRWTPKSHTDSFGEQSDEAIQYEIASPARHALLAASARNDGLPRPDMTSGLAMTFNR